MTTIRLHRSLFSAAAPEVFDVDHLAEWLLDQASRGPRINRLVFIGAPSRRTDITRDKKALIASDQPVYTVLEAPGAVLIPYIPVILSLYSIAAAFMASKPDMLENVNRSQQSPNNALGVRENQVRVRQRTEDIYGVVPSTPSVMMVTYPKYLNNIKYEFGYYCVGRGYYEIREIRDGETLISDIGDSSAAVYKPFTSPNSGDAPAIQIGPAIIDRIPTVRRSVEVDGITLKAQNQIQLEPSSGYYLFQPGAAGGPPAPPGSLRPTLSVPAASTDRVVQFYKRPNFNAVVTVGQTIEITTPLTTSERTSTMSVVDTTRRFTSSSTATFAGLSVGSSFTVSNMLNPENNGSFFVESIPNAFSVVVVAPTVPLVIESMSVDVVVAVPMVGGGFNGVRTVLEVGDGWLILVGATFPRNYNDDLLDASPKTNIVANNGLVDWTDWVTMTTVDRNEVWINVLAQSGMYKDNGGRSGATVAYEMQLQQLDAGLAPIGGIVTVGGSLSGVTAAEVAETLETATAWTGPTRVRVRRLTPFDYNFQGQVVDEIKWVDLFAVSPVNKAHFGNRTTIHTITPATPRSTAVKQRQLNCIASRLLPKWTGSGFTGAFDATGRHVSGVLHETPFIQDIIAAVTLDPKIGNRPLSDLHMEQMQGVADQLYAIHPDLPRFSYTFDSDNISFEETLQTIANACFCVAYRQGGKIRLGLDRKQPYSAKLFTHRNKKPQAETLTRTFTNAAEFDGVEFVYQDPDSKQSETIRLPLDGSATKYKPFEIPGIRSFPQAWIRANREYYKLIGQRLTIETVCTTDARALLPNLRIDIVDNTRFKSFDGEITGQDGLVLTLSQPIEFTPDQPHSIVLMRRDGSVESIDVSEISGRNDQVLLASPPTEAIVTEEGDDGIRTIFSFASDDDREKQPFLVGEMDPPKDNYVTVRAMNYSDSYYQMDLQPIPPRTSVIN